MSPTDWTDIELRDHAEGCELPLCRRHGRYVEELARRGVNHLRWPGGVAE